MKALQIKGVFFIYSLNAEKRQKICLKNTLWMCYYDIVEKISYEDELFATWFPPEPLRMWCFI